MEEGDVNEAELKLAMQLIEQAAGRVRPGAVQGRGLRQDPRADPAEGRGPGDHRRAGRGVEDADHRPHGRPQGVPRPTDEEEAASPRPVPERRTAKKSSGVQEVVAQEGRVGLTAARAGRSRVTGYSTREVSEVLGIPASTILAWTRARTPHPRARGPGRLPLLLPGHRAASLGPGAPGRGGPTRRVRRSAGDPRAQLPCGRALSARCTWSALGRPGPGPGRGAGVGARRRGRSSWTSARRPATRNRPRPVARRTRLAGTPGARPRTADDWFDAALDLEGTRPSGPGRPTAALELDPGHADAHLNLGRLLHEGGDLAGAEAQYRAALEADPSSARALYNLGVAMEDQGRRAEALRRTRALRLDPDWRRHTSTCPASSRPRQADPGARAPGRLQAHSGPRRPRCLTPTPRRRGARRRKSRLFRLFPT